MNDIINNAISFLISWNNFEDLKNIKLLSIYEEKEYIPISELNFSASISELKKISNINDDKLFENFLYKLYKYIIKLPVISEETLKIGDKVNIYGSYHFYNYVIDKISIAYYDKSITPYIKDVNSNFCPKDKITFPIFHANDLWFTFRYNGEILKDNDIAVFLDDNEMGHIMWCGGNGILKIFANN